MDKVLIDTDVVMDFFFDRDPFSEHAAKIFSLCELKSIQGYITPVIYNNVYYLLKQTAKHEIVIKKLSQLLSITDVLEIDKEVVKTALNSKFKDFENALQNYAAVNSRIFNAILTRNIKDYKSSEIAVFTPEDYLNLKFARH